jgi:hypothetical protein
MSSKLRAIFFLNRSFILGSWKFGDRLIVVIEQGGIAERTFNAADRTINNITTTIVFSYFKLNPYREIAKE